MREDIGSGDEVMQTDDNMNSGNQGGSESSEGFFEIKQRFLLNRNEESAVELLKHLTDLDTGNIDRDVWPDVKDLVRCLLDTITLEHLIRKYQIILLNAINKCSEHVIDLLADYFNKNDRVVGFFKDLSSSDIAVIIAFARRITDPICAQSIAEILWRFAHLESVQNELKADLNTEDAEKRFRIHQVTATYLKKRDDPSKINRLIEALISEVDSDDILSKLNAVELLADAASNDNSTASYLLSIGVVDRLYVLLQNVKLSPDSGFIFPAIIKFFGHLAVRDVECLRQYPLFLESLFDMVYHFDLLDPSQRLLTFDTFAVITQSNQSKIFFNSLADKYDLNKAMNAFGVAICSGPLELRVRHIDALAMMMRHSDSDNNEASEIAHGWFKELGEPFPTVVLSYVSKPFPEIRMATLKLFNELFCYGWAIKIFMTTAGFMECMLNRNVETTAEGKQMKFGVICRLIDHGSSEIPAEDLMKFKLYRREGAFHIDRPPQIDMQND